MNENNAALTGNWNYPTHVRFDMIRTSSTPLDGALHTG